MTTTTIIPKYINSPKPGKRLGSVKDQDDTLWLTPPEAMAGMVVGLASLVEWVPLVFQDGTQGKKITSSRPVDSGATRPSMVTTANGVDKEEHIFITGIVGRAMGSGKFADTDIPLLTKAAKDAWRIVIGGNPQEPTARGHEHPSLLGGDNIPF